MKELEILDIKKRIDDTWSLHKNMFNEESKKQIKSKFDELIAREFDSYMQLYMENEIKHIEESLKCENVFNMTEKDVPQNIVKWVAHGPKYNPFVQKSTKKLMKEFDQAFCDTIVMLIRQHDKSIKASFGLEHT